MSRLPGRSAAPDGAGVELGGQNMGQVSRMEIARRGGSCESLQLNAWQQQVARVMLQQIDARLGLPGGGRAGVPDTRSHAAHVQRRRGAARGADVRAGLQPGQHALRAGRTVRRPASDRMWGGCSTRSRTCSERRNTVVVVEHEEAMLRAADQLIEIGPAAGERGGEVVFQGTLAEMAGGGSQLDRRLPVRPSGGFRRRVSGGTRVTAGFACAAHAATTCRT